MEKLEQIESFHEEVESCEKREGIYEFFLSQAEVDLVKERTRRLEEEIRTEEYRQKHLGSQLEETEKERAQKQEIETNLRVELRQNREFVALEEQKKELETSPGGREGVPGREERAEEKYQKEPGSDGQAPENKRCGLLCQRMPKGL